MIGNLGPHDTVVALMKKAAALLEPRDIATYAYLREFIVSGMAGDRTEFKRRFATFYGLNGAGLTPAFLQAYFDMLFMHRASNDCDPYTPILLQLHAIPRRQGGHIVAASFVSKLVAIHDEAGPLFDRHVQAFFGLGVPALGPVAFRIAGFVENLHHIRRTYEVWSHSTEMIEIHDRVRQAYPNLTGTHPHRICDFLVWAIGARLRREIV